MSWRTARSLLVLRDEVNAFAPNRSKRFDGAIGDTAHASRPSRHNPNAYGVVTALDLTHDPAGGCDIHRIARQVAHNPHPELAYIISNREIAGPATGWLWSAYGGSNPHTIHAHFAVGQGPDGNPQPPYDSTVSWGIADVTEDRRMEELVTGLQQAVKDAGHDPGPVDGSWGPRTQAGLTAALKASGQVQAASEQSEFLRQFEQNMKAAGGTPSSVVHVLEWYRKWRDAYETVRPGP